MEEGTVLGQREEEYVQRLGGERGGVTWGMWSGKWPEWELGWDCGLHLYGSSERGRALSCQGCCEQVWK